MERVDEHSTALAVAIEDAVPGWVQRSVAAELARAGVDADAEVAVTARIDAETSGRRAAVEVGAEVRRLLSTDIDQQRVTPLTLLREAVRFPTEVLRRAGVAPTVERDDVRVRLFPDDVYDLSPASFGDVDPRLTEPGLVWGASKAFEHLRRRKAATGVKPEGDVNRL